MISRRTGHLLLVNSIQGKLAVPFRTTCELSCFTLRTIILNSHSRSCSILKTQMCDSLITCNILVRSGYFFYCKHSGMIVNSKSIQQIYHQNQTSGCKNAVWRLIICCFLHIPDAASKHAVQAFFDCLRAEVEEFGITVSTVNHTFISSLASEAPATKSIWSCEQSQTKPDRETIRESDRVSDDSSNESRAGQVVWCSLVMVFVLKASLE